MAKKLSAKKSRSKKTRTRLSKKDVQVQTRLAQLGYSMMRVSEDALAINLEIGKKYPKLGEAALLISAAKHAMEEAILASNDPNDWIRAARKAGGL